MCATVPAAGRYQLLIVLGGAETLMADFRTFVSLWARDKASQQTDNCSADDDMSDEVDDVGGFTAAG
jgi:hypothetical protein